MGKWKEKNEALDEVLKAINKNKVTQKTVIDTKKAYTESNYEKKLNVEVAKKQKTFDEMTDEEKKKVMWG